MRIDQFLWYVRIFKTRSLATIQCKKGLVKVNSIKVRPSFKISPTDRLEIRKNQFWHTFQVLDFPTHRVSAKMVGLYYNYLSGNDDLQTMKSIKLIPSPLRRKGAGRPTKKERRKIDSIIEN
ncbi:MAG: S4 domain-containing protein [Flavobacteriaceae bacterium]|nr:S4 domain-containing protein [Flavobacteriaceae bacterium]MCY4216459.1 S4 domain-containing protein [Flavobacteriaceae bacterium]MCY4253956.1 S4 domain-containing protein [Flavobacteriaceae bacterium]